MRRTTLLLVLTLLAGVVPTLAEDRPPMSVEDFRHLAIEDPRAGLERGEELLGDPYAANHPEWSREILNRMARGAILLADAEQTDVLARRLEELGANQGDVFASAYAQFIRAVMLAESGRNEEAIDMVTKAAAALNATNDPIGRATAVAELCDVNTRMIRPDLAVPYCEQARELWVPLGDWFQIARIDNFRSINLGGKGRIDDAIRLAELARDEFEKAGMPSLAIMVKDNMAGMYLEKGDAKTALSLSRESLELELASGKASHAVLSRMNIASALSMLGRHDEALAQIEQAIDEAKTLDYEVALPDLYEVQLDVAERAGRLRIASEAGRNALEASRVLSTTTLEQAIAGNEARYRALEKQRQIDDLAQQNRIKALELEAAEAKLKRQQLGITLAVVAGISFAAVALLLFLLLRVVRRREQEFEELSRTDSLTGAANRRALLHSLDAALSSSPPKEAALLVIDADHFKRVNDNHGHQAGDRVLRHIVATIRSCVRASDTLGRLGGEEFGVLLTPIDVADAMARAERIRDAIATSLCRIEGIAIDLSVSIGVAMLEPGRYPTVDQWLGAADRALYAAKRAGRNRVERIE